MSPYKRTQLHPNETHCLACITPAPLAWNEPAPWWWHLASNPDEFCERHVVYRFPTVWLQYSAQEWAQAETDWEETDYYGRLEYFLPDRLMRCTACGHETLADSQDGLMYHRDYSCRFSGWSDDVYSQLQPDPWDIDDFALPLREGMERTIR